jgi:predicted HNH restriction endonuclease
MGHREMINKDYRQAALKTYGDKCEICGHSQVEVHHIDYQEQWDMEGKARAAEKDRAALNGILVAARAMGYIKYERGQLSKNDSTKNLSVLCGNCHGLVHKMDVGMRLLKVLKTRK